ncbi:MAG: hypothetical protein HEQ22_08870 [Sphingopyxis sp.]|uniref:class III lanthionine synthetase LanKC N-terminal domain-containing protein n=1 Tax=Sphingopyxis sp. TaxID=1908224 RepID=UPI003D810204
MSERTALLHAYEEALSCLRGRLGNDWSVRRWRDGDCGWQFHAPPDAADVAQGWKVHVAVAVSEAACFARTLAPLLADLCIPFKLPASLDAIAAINAGEGGAEQVGKIVTLYPANDAQARDAILAIDRLWPSSAAPAIRTSLHLRPGSAVAFRFGAFTARHPVVDSRGIIHAGVHLPDGSLVPDVRVFGGQPPPGITPPLPGVAAEGWDDVAGTHETIAGLHLVMLGEIARTAHSRLLFAATRDVGETLIVRQRAPGETRYPGDGSAAERIAREYEVLEAIGGAGRCAPRAIASSSGRVPSLVMEDVEGSLLSELAGAARVRAMPSVAAALAEVHRRGWTHGDVKLENAILREDVVALIDFELAVPVGTPISGRGTDAYMAPEAARGAPADPAHDVYALGVSLFHAVTGFPPSLLPPRRGLLAELLRHEGADAAAQLVERMTADDPAARPSAAECVELLAQLADAAGSAPPLREAALDRPSLRASIAAAIAATADFRVAGDTGHHWRNAHFQRHFACEAINIGAAGILIGLLAAGPAGGVDGRDDIAGAADWLASRPATGQAAGLFTGNAGVALALAAAGRALGTDAYVSAARARLAAAAADDREFDLFSGSAGTVFAAAAMAELLGATWPLAFGEVALQKLTASQVTVDDVISWRGEGDKDGDFLGCAHGNAGVAAALGYWARVTGDRDADAVAISALKALGQRAMLSTQGQGMPMRLDSDRAHAPGNWCHGTAGYLWAILAGPGARDELAAEIDWAVASLAALPAIATPTYCHGLAGQLELWQMVSAIERHRALAAQRVSRLAAALTLLRSTGDAPGPWIADDSAIVTPDLWVGFMGPAAALALAVTGERRSIIDGGFLRDAADGLAARTAEGACAR